MNLDGEATDVPITVKAVAPTTATSKVKLARLDAARLVQLGILNLRQVCHGQELVADQLCWRQEGCWHRRLRLD